MKGPGLTNEVKVPKIEINFKENPNKQNKESPPTLQVRSVFDTKPWKNGSNNGIKLLKKTKMRKTRRPVNHKKTARKTTW